MSRAPSTRRRDRGTGSYDDAGDGANPPVFAPATRRLLTAGGIVVAVVIAGWASTLPDEHDTYILAHAVASAPFLAVSLACTWRAMRVGPPEYRSFYVRLLWACGTGAVATVAGAGAVLGDSPALLALDVVMLAAGQPLWAAATLHMLRAERGRRSTSVDLIDAGTAMAVLGAPVALLVAEPLSQAEEMGFAVPFAVAAVATPGVGYLAAVSMSQIRPGQRAAFAIGVALSTAFALSITLQFARAAGALETPLPVAVAVHEATMLLLMAVPLWAHRRPSGRLGRLPADRQARHRNPMPYLAAALLPVLAVHVFAARDERPWGVPFLVVVLLVVVMLGAARYTAMSRESRRLYGDLARMSEERRRLLAGMLRALDDDRHRTATELHAQAIQSLTALATTIQTAYVALPPGTALAVKEAISQAHDDLAARAEDLRRLMEATGVVGGGLRDGGDPPANALAAALSAYAAELYRDHPGVTVTVEVDPALHLDWATTTIACRIAQEALVNAARHAGASTVAARIVPCGDGVLVEVCDDGVGFDADRVQPGSGLASLQLFSHLGRGELTVRSTPGGGTVVRSVLSTASDRPAAADRHGHGRHRHLHAVKDPGPA